MYVVTRCYGEQTRARRIPTIAFSNFSQRSSCCRRTGLLVPPGQFVSTTTFVPSEWNWCEQMYEALRSNGGRGGVYDPPFWDVRYKTPVSVAKDRGKSGSSR